MEHENEEVLDNPVQSGPEQLSEVEPEKKKKSRKQLFVRRSTMEWVSTLAICALVMYFGFAIMTAMSSTSGWNLLVAVFGSISRVVRFGLLIATAVLAGTVARKNAGWLAIPAGLGAVLCGLEIWNSARVVGVVAYGLITKQMTVTEVALYLSSLLPYALEFIIILFTILALIFGMVAYLNGKCRVVSVVFWVLWAVSYIALILVNTAGAFMDNLNRVAVCIYAVLLVLTACLPLVKGKRVVKSQLSALQVEDELVYWLEKNGKKELPNTPTEEEKDPEDDLAVPPDGEQPGIEQETQTEPVEPELEEQMTQEAPTEE